MRRLALAVVFSTVFAAPAAYASDAVAAADKTTDAAVADTAKDASMAPPIRLESPKHVSTIPGRAALLSLHAGLATLQGYDVYSTAKALKSGAVEINPLLRNTVGSRAAFIGLKVAMTAGPIVAAEHMWRDGHRVGAIALMALSNGMMAIVASHNAAVISQARR